MATAKKVAVVTGATSGIGRATAKALAQRGWRVIGVGRDPKRSLHVSQAIRAQTGNPAVTFLTADLLLQDEVKRLAVEILKLQPKIDLLINNAGSLFQKRLETAEGFERTLALNHLAPFTLTNALADGLVGGRIITVASDLHRRAHLKIDDLQPEEGYRGLRQYCNTKLMNVLFTRGLVQHGPIGCVPLCLHPGFVATRFGNENGLIWRGLMRIMQALGAITPEKAAAGIMKVVEAPAPAPGSYHYRGRLRAPSLAGQSDELAEALWRATESLLRPDRK